jgi:3',5'-cyclic AMP phosphodiesterase CpdA
MPAYDIENSPDNYQIFITSDNHSFFDSLHDNSQALADMEASGDGKLITYNQEIMEAFVNDVLARRPQAVILSGDLTLNGERLGHMALAALLEKITDAGIRVLVIPGNHDINSPHSIVIRDGKYYRTANVSPNQFRNIYSRSGYEGALYYDRTSLSYIARLNSYLYAVMIDSCLYKPNRVSAGGTISTATLRWLEKSVNSIKRNNKDAQFITVLHHNIFAHHKDFVTNYVINTADTAIGVFSRLGLNIVFSGHIHIQHIMSKTNANGSTMTEIVNGSLVTYPVIYGVAEFERTGMVYHTQEINIGKYARQNSLEDENLLDFELYARTMFNERSARNTSRRLRMLQRSDEEIDEAVETIKLINTYYFAGRIGEIADELPLMKGFQILMDLERTQDYVTSVLEDGRGEHNRIEIAW